ncbi:MAG: alcohol dehydrogenase [bacterium]|nr:MAG: alcohol dehydrogenase [bacterium]
MKAVHYDSGTKRLEYRADMVKPVPAQGEALIKVLKSGICRTDLEIARGYMEFCGIPGHEFVGVVEDATDNNWIGSRVVGEINCGCGVCAECMKGDKNHCPSRTVLGILKRDGVFAEYLTLPAENLHHVPDSVNDEEALFVEPLSAAFRVSEQVVLRGNSVLVMGDGKLGLLIAQVAALLKADVTLCGRHSQKLSLVETMGIAAFHHGEMPRSGKLYDVVVDATGSSEGIKQAISRTRPRGYTVIKTTVAKPAQVDLNRIVIDEISLVGSRCGSFEHGLMLLEDGAVNVKFLIDKTFPIERSMEAFEAAAKPGAMKVILVNTRWTS